MDDDTRSYYERKTKQYREELKSWEHAWLRDNGAKPSRGDIKSNPDVASKYKLFQKAQDILSGKTAPPPKEPSRQHKRKSPEAPALSGTPLKRAKHIETPSNTRFHDQSTEETPTISRKLFTPSANTSLGPTPQRDGHVLGLFDLLEDGTTAATPSRKHNGGVAETPSRTQATPSKPSSTLDVEVTPRLGRTPMSDSKRQYLNTFISPLKNRDGNIGAQTPSKLHFDTPKFLRRHTLSTVDENGDFDKPAPLRLPRKPLGRGLSEIVASLRKDEEDKADEDLEALREVEAAELGQPIPKKAPPKQAVEVEDSQNPQLPLGGFDDEGQFDSDPDEGKDTNGQPLRIYKKKGQKRTTRKVNIKPTWNKRPTTTTREQQDDDGDDDVVPKTQYDDAPFNEDDNGISSASEDETKKKVSKKREKDSKEKKDGPVKKVARKVNELAHANFQKLKLKQGGAKGGPGYNSRFRRRR